MIGDPTSGRDGFPVFCEGFLQGRGHRLELPFRKHSVVVRPFAAWSRFRIHSLEIRCNHDARAGVSDQIPADEVRVSSVERVRESSLYGVCANEVEELPGTSREA